MKKIFDTIRSKWAEYLMEILVIMIGILGAFGLNNWNDQQREFKKETQLLMELRDNLTEDVKTFQNEVDNQQMLIINLGKLIDHFEDGQQYHDTLRRYIGSSGWLERFEVNISAFESLKNIGLDKISSTSLKKSISKYYNIDNPHRADIVDRLNLEQQDSHVLLEREAWDSYDGNYNEIMVYLSNKDRTVINYLHSRIGWKRAFIHDIIRPSIANAEDMILQIDIELENR